MTFEIKQRWILILCTKFRIYFLKHYLNTNALDLIKKNQKMQ